MCLNSHLLGCFRKHLDQRIKIFEGEYTKKTQNQAQGLPFFKALGQAFVSRQGSF